MKLWHYQIEYFQFLPDHLFTFILLFPSKVAVPLITLTLLCSSNDETPETKVFTTVFFYFEAETN